MTLAIVAVGVLGACAILFCESPWEFFVGMGLGLLFFGVVMFFAGCGPTWDQVRVHDNGIIEDPATRECWTPDFVPVICPSDRIMDSRLRAVARKGH